MKKVTVSVFKADVGSIGGHTKPSEKMLSEVDARLVEATQSGLFIDGVVTHTGDDIAVIASHEKGVDNKDTHQFAWKCFLAASEVAQEYGLYGAGQDLLVDAPAGNIRGAGPAIAEVEFYRAPELTHRPAEVFLVFAADKCGPGAYNYPLYSTFCDPMYNGGLLLSPNIRQGFTLTIMDMDATEGDRVIRLSVPERNWDVAVLLQNPDRFAISSIHSRYKPEEQVASVSTTRLHNIAGKYTGKDDPVAIVRSQGIFPAPEEIVAPYTLGHFVVGDARGSHVMPIMPVAINTPIAGTFCLPLVSCLTFSMDEHGKFTDEYVDIFGNIVWDATRLKVQKKADEWRRQGFIGPTMAAQAELAYTGIVEAQTRLDSEFVVLDERELREAGG